ncbi:MAG: flagellar basal body-associated FliL family protein [Desulfovibrio sp.]|nr:flagellar basal body-associated FliL family protein [Desulfovibrio sp.]
MADETAVKEAPAADEVQVAERAALIEKKVQLDLDDAPFLQEESKNVPAAREEGATKPAASGETAEAAAPKQGMGRKKLIILAAGAIFLLLAALAVVWWFFLRRPPPPPVEAAKPEVIVVPSKPATQAAPDYTKEFSSFLVYHPDDKGKGRFLVCKFTTLTKAQGLSREMDQKMLPLRDALYYYLNSKSPEYLINSKNIPAIKKDLTAVINNYLVQGQVEDILFESYLSE